MTNKERERVRWACRRGMLECDLFLVPFFEDCYDGLSQKDKVLFETLLTESDVLLFAWFMKTESADERYESILDRIRKHKKSYTFS